MAPPQVKVYRPKCWLPSPIWVATTASLRVNSRRLKHRRQLLRGLCAFATGSEEQGRYRQPCVRHSHCYRGFLCTEHVLCAPCHAECFTHVMAFFFLLPTNAPGRYCYHTHCAGEEIGTERLGYSPEDYGQSWDLNSEPECARKVGKEAPGPASGREARGT